MTLLKTLVLYNEMDIVLRIASSRDVDLSESWDCFWHSSYSREGFSGIVETALLAYICLNVLFLKPELHTPEATRQYLGSLRPNVRASKEGEILDYRLTRGYQKMLSHYVYKSDVPQGIPHRLFFGCLHGIWEECGRQSIPTLISGMNLTGYVPHKDDITFLRQMLSDKGLRPELILTILEFAEYTTPQRRMPVPYDPLHRENRPELRKYLNYCWQLLVRVNMLVQAREISINWEESVSWGIYTLFGVSSPKMIVGPTGDERYDDPCVFNRMKLRFRK